MAHGFLQSFNKDIEVFSAGTNPSGKINKIAVEVMKEVGIDISQNKPKPVEKYLFEPWDYVITVCDDANETCPVFSGKVNTRLHIGFEDPAKVTGSEEFIVNEFRRVRDEIELKFLRFYEKNLKMEMC